MKPQIILFPLVVYCGLLPACERNDGLPDNFSNLSTDSLKILQTDIPVNQYTDLVFIDELHGLAISGFGDIIKTNDGGYSWEKLPSPANFFLSKILFVDNTTGYIIGGDNTGGYLLKTSDTGKTWQLTDLQTPDNEMPTGITFIDKDTGFITGKNLLRKTNDAGKTWSDVMNNISENFNDIGFKNSSEGYITCNSGKYFKTTDGGKTWKPLQVNTSYDLKKIYFAGSITLAKCPSNVFVDLGTGNIAFTVPAGAHEFLFIDERRSIGIGQHYEDGFLPYGDIFLTNDSWETFGQKKYTPQSEAMNVTAVAKISDGKVVMIGSGTINSSVISLHYE